MSAPARAIIAPIPAELVGPAGQVTAVEFDAALAERAESFFSGRTNVRVVCDDGAHWPETPADGVYVNFAVSRPADRWIENLARDGRLMFPLGVPGQKRPNSGGRHSDRGAALNDAATPIRRGRSARRILPAPKEDSRLIPTIWRGCAAFEAGGLDTVRSLIWKRPAPSNHCWFAGEDWALSGDETP